VHAVLRTPGQALAAGARAFFEAHLGQDLSHVRVHTDSRAAQSARVVQALAYTVGPSIVFAAGQYAPDTAAGKHLLAHELTHVLQQGEGGGSVTRIGPVDDRYEQQAERVARALDGTSATPSRSAVLPRGALRSGLRLQRLGANPGCTDGETSLIHQAIFN